MRPRENELIETDTKMNGAFGRPHIVAMWPGGSVVKHVVRGGTLTVGRSKTCDIVIDHGSVSREHAVFHGSDPIAIEDVGSTNGTIVGGTRAKAHARVVIERGQVVSIGAAVLVVRGAFDSGILPEAQPDSRSESPSGPPSSPRRRQGAGTRGPAPVIVVDDAMRELHRVVALVAKGELSVILLGETGAGKDVIADSIHRSSPRASSPYVRVNCAALPEALLESELFGYERGAFTGAVNAKPGLLEIADGGTLFFDEIAELPLVMQAKLLRVLENHEITRVGGLKSRSIDVRFLCATNRDLGALVRSGAFRQDLYFRLNGISLVIPPLRSRRGEIAPLAAEFVVEACLDAGRPPLGMTDDALTALERHDWPGNVRELRNAIERAVTLCTGDTIDTSHLPPLGREHAPHFAEPSAHASATQVAPSTERRDPEPETIPAAADPASFGAQNVSLGLYDAAKQAAQTIERRRIAEAMERCGGNQTRAAQLLRVSRRTLVARLTEYGFARPLKDRGSSP